MPSYLVESYVPRGSSEELEAVAARARAAARAVSAQGKPVRYVRSALLPRDELCLHLFEADSADWVSEASELAGIAAERVVPAVLEPATPQRQSKEET
jgi:hypothetical protein